MRIARTSRRAFTIVYAMVALVLIGSLTNDATRSVLAMRRAVESRRSVVQGEWLARAGLDIATARLAADPKYRGEKLNLAAGTIEITIGEQIVARAVVASAGPADVVVSRSRPVTAPGR